MLGFKEFAKIEKKGHLHTKKRKASFETFLFRTPAGGRTLDTLIKSQVLYQLSYGSIVLRVQKYNLFLFPQYFFSTFFIYSCNLLFISKLFAHYTTPINLQTIA